MASGSPPLHFGIKVEHFHCSSAVFCFSILEKLRAELTVLTDSVSRPISDCFDFKKGATRKLDFQKSKQIIFSKKYCYSCILIFEILLLCFRVALWIFEFLKCQQNP